MSLFLAALLLASEPLILRGPARAGQFMEASGRRASFLGREDGSFEAWVYPMKVLHGFELAFEIDDYAEPIDGASLATEVEIRPEASRVRYSHASFTADVTWLVPLEEEGGLVLLDIDASEPVKVRARFHTDLKLMWPAGLGGQYSHWDDALHAYVLTESTRKHAALIGSPYALRPTDKPAHNLPEAPSEMWIEPRGNDVVPIAIAASVGGLSMAQATYERLIDRFDELHRVTEAHYRKLREERTRIDSPDDDLDLALEWGKVTMDKGLVCNPQLGCGLVAGLGPSGRSERPGFGWFFGGDAFINSWAMTAYGDFETVEQSLEFLRERQRDDGKMMHELSQGAAYIPWFEEFPYGYYHADTTPLYIVAVWDYVRASGRLDFARRLWPSLREAYAYCLSADEDGDGLMDNSRAGLGAVETGALRSTDVLTDVYLASVWTEATKATSQMARAIGENAFALEAERASERASAALAKKFVGEHGISFALLKSGAAQNEVTVWPAFGLWRRLVQSEAALDDMASSRLGADWGARMLSRESTLYDPLSYNNGAVWPFLTGFAALALYENDRAHAAWSYLQGAKELTFLGARGYVPELLSGDRLKPVDSAVPHQLFATFGLVAPLLRGLVGFEPGRLAPRIPPSWDRLRVENLRHPSGLFDFEWRRARSGSEERLFVRLEPRGETRLDDLNVELSLPPGAEPISLDSTPRASRTPMGGWRLLWQPGSGGALELRYLPGVEIEPIQPPLREGDRSSRLRILDARLSGDTYTARVEGRAGTTYRLRAFIPFEIASLENARFVEGELEVTIPDGSDSWERLDVVMALRGRR